MNDAALSDQPDFSLLSPREAEVVEVAREGLSARGIAERLSLTEATVRSHLSAAYSKLGVSGRVELMARMKGPPPNGGDAADLATKSKSPRIRLRTLTLWSYLFVFGAIFSFPLLADLPREGNGPDSGLLVMWTLLGMAGSILAMIKNHLIHDRRLRSRLIYGDFFAIALGIAVLALLPSNVGVLKGPLELILSGAYCYWSLRALERAAIR